MSVTFREEKGRFSRKVCWEKYLELREQQQQDAAAYCTVRTSLLLNHNE